MFLQFGILILCAAVTVMAVRTLLMYGIDVLSTALRFSSKTKGQIIGYATSIPELVVVVSSALAGVFDAGFWNIASSNIINFVLFSLAVLTYRQHRDLLSRRFIDEVVFGAISIAIPVVMAVVRVKLNMGVAGMLLVMFVAYKVLDRLLNTGMTPASDEHHEAHGGIGLGLLAMVGGIAAVVIAGRFLGSSAESLVAVLGIPAWLIGWILGFITSIPELTSFFEIYRVEKKRGRLHTLEDTQQALDALVSSNMVNLGVIIPVGVFVLAVVVMLG